MYQQRRGTLKDATAIAPLWQSFLQQRTKYDPSLILKSHFDYLSYVKKKLASPSIYSFLLEYEETQDIVGFLFTYVHDETPSLDYEDVNDSPFLPRRMGGAMGMYIQPQHRKPEAITLLVENAITLAEKLKLSDLDLLISIEQTGVQKLLERFGFKKAAIQYSQHYDISDQDLPPLQNPISENIAVQMPQPAMIPLRDPKTQQPIINPQGKQVFLHSVKNQLGETLKSSNGLPIYPTPLRDPQSQEWVFDAEGNLVTCPVLLDNNNNIVEYQGIPVFCPPLYERFGDKLILKKNDQGNYLFAEVDTNKDGTIKRSPDGKPLFKSS
ncbi:N-acetyltransferase [Cyanothece sp. BG0011]|uniref:N-acetyltransferase n=1 Tax=Cyanothece sp. BG0011 TaxID=2082950 RepID=UPI000D1DA945|nr:N-acetyltransferase [Cyanothece sp. BG0011]